MELVLLPIPPAAGPQGATAGRVALSESSQVAEPFLALACDYAEAVLPYLTAQQALPFYGAVRELLRVYAAAASAAGFVRRRGEGVGGGHDEMEDYDDVLKVMQLLTHLISKDFIDYAPSDAAADGECPPKIKV